MLENVRHLILTVTRDCNLNCQYCFESNKHLYRREKMPLAVFEKFLEKFVADRQKYQCQMPLEICFHGGEPTLVGRAALQEFIDAAREQLGVNNVDFAMQTNGTLLNKDWQAFAVKNQVKTSVSLDGYTYKHNRFRFAKKADFRGYFRRLKGVKLMGSISLLTKNNLTAMLRYLLFAHYKQHWGAVVNVAEFVDTTSAHPQEITGAQLAKNFYLPFIRWAGWFPGLHERHVSKMLKSFFLEYLYEKKTNEQEISLCRLCETKFCSAGNGLINLLPDGDLWACQRSLGLQDYRVGSVFDDSPDPFGLKHFAKLYVLALPQARAVRVRHCDLCLAAEICDYGCKAFALQKTQGQTAIRDDLACAAYKIVREYLARNIYDALFAAAVLAGYAIRKDRDKVRIYMPAKVWADGDLYELSAVSSRSISISRKQNSARLSFARKHLGWRNSLILNIRSFLTKRRKRK
jgi:radical SAM protein with 4Fe4S-binding SPASM domain